MVTSLSLLLSQAPSLVTVTPRSELEYAEPQVAIENDGHVYVAYGSGDTIFVSVSNDKGKSFGSPVKVAETGKLSLGMRRGPRITANKGNVTVTAVYGATGKGQDGDIATFRSTDHGATWFAGAKVNDVSAAAREGLHAMTVSSDGTLACSWLDLRSRGTKLFMATSKDGGASWSKNQLVYESPSGSICECCHPSLTYDPFGRLTIMFRNSLNGARDMYVTSTSNGQTFSQATKVGTGTWMINACPMDGGMIFSGDSSARGAIWRRENTIYYEFSGNDLGELALGQGKQPWAAVGGEGDIYAIWAGTSGITSVKLGDSAKVVSPQGTDPVVSSSPDRKIVFAAWANGGIQGMQMASL